MVQLIFKDNGHRINDLENQVLRLSYNNEMLKKENKRIKEELKVKEEQAWQMDMKAAYYQSLCDANGIEMDSQDNDGQDEVNNLESNDDEYSAQLELLQNHLAKLENQENQMEEEDINLSEANLFINESNIDEEGLKKKEKPKRVRNERRRKNQEKKRKR